MVKQTDLERAFDTQFIALGQDLPRPQSEYYFAKPRKWRVDRAWPEYKVAVEIEGGTWGRKVICHNCGQVVHAKTAGGKVGKQIRLYGGHNAAGFKKDIEKYNRLAADGWILLRYTNEDIYADPHSMVKQIRGALESRAYQVAEIARLSKLQEKSLYLIAAGFKTAEIAERMNTTETALRRSVQKTCQRLEVNTRAAAVARAIAWGVIDLEEIPWIVWTVDLIK